ncbi:MAG: bacteriocin, partial [Rhodopila sp.]
MNEVKLRELTDKELDQVSGGAGQTWYTQQVNGGGKT